MDILKTYSVAKKVDSVGIIFDLSEIYFLCLSNFKKKLCDVDTIKKLKNKYKLFNDIKYCLSICYVDLIFY